MSRMVVIESDSENEQEHASIELGEGNDIEYIGERRILLPTSSNIRTIPIVSGNDEELVERNDEEMQLDDIIQPSQPPPHYEAITPLEDIAVLPAIEQFIDEFESNYGIHRPPFFYGTFEDVKYIAQKTGKFIFVYLHDKNKEETDLFCSQILCSEPIVQCLETYFMVWAWDITQPSYLYKLRSIMNSNMDGGGYMFLNPVAPFIAIMAVIENNLQCLDSASGLLTLDELIIRLISSIENHLDKVEEYIRNMAKIQQERDHIEQIKREQDLEYNQSLEKDAKKALEKEEKMRMKLHEDEQKLKKEADEKMRMEKLLFSLPAEPTEADLKYITKIMIRLPDGSKMQRCFAADDKLKLLFDFLGSKGFFMETYEAVTNFPRRVISQMDNNLTFKDAGLFPQETIFIQ